MATRDRNPAEEGERGARRDAQRAPTRHSIPIGHETRGRPGHYSSGAILRVAGASRDGGPGGWGVGGWTIDGEGRLVNNGDLVRGPVAYFFGRCGVIDGRGGTGADYEAAAAKGLLFDVVEGDELELAGTVFVVSLTKGLRFPRLEVVS